MAGTLPPWGGKNKGRGDPVVGDMVRNDILRFQDNGRAPGSEISIDLQRCDGCGDCVTACLRQLAERPGEEGGRGPARVKVLGKGPLFWLSICRQCDEAPCIDACITGALRQGEDPDSVRLDEETCVGCGMCVMACPFGAVWLDVERGKAVKCDLCAHLDLPPCVEACKPRALTVRPTSRLAGERRRRTTRGRLTPDKRAAVR